MNAKIAYGAMMIVMLAVGIAGGYFFATSSAPPPRQDLLSVVQQRGYMIVGTSADYPPWEFMSNTTRQISGLDVDIVNAIAQRMNVTVKWQDMDFDGLIAACKGGQVDMLAAAMGLTPDRMTQLDYSLVYYSGFEILVAKADATFTIGNLTDIGKLNLQVGVQPGTNQEDELNRYVAAGLISQSQIHEYPRVDLMILDLVSGRIDTAYIETGPAQAFAKIYPIKSVYEEKGTSVGDVLYFSKDQPEFRDAVNKALATLIVDGTIDALVAKWLGGGSGGS